MDEQSVRGIAGVGQTAARGLVATALTLSLVPSLAYASPENEEEASSATNTEEASSHNEAVTTSNNDYTPVVLADAIGNASVNYDLAKIADGTYEGKAVIGDDGLTIDGAGTDVSDGDEWVGYTLNVKVTVANHKIVKIEIPSDDSGNYTDVPDESQKYAKKAAAGNTKVTGMFDKIVEANSTDVDTVSGATVTSKAIIVATNNALENAETEDVLVTEETKQKLQALYDQAAALNKADYTEESWEKSAIETETAETKDLLAKENLTESEASEQITHLQGAIDALVKAETGISEGTYLLMNIPYAQLYAADTTNNDTAVDVFTSATVSKSQTGKLSGGSYGGITNVTEADGKKTTEISGAQFPVKLSQAAAEKIKASDYAVVTDETTKEVTTTNRGQTSTTTYSGKKALYCEGDYAYYVLGDDPSFYKELDVDANGSFVLSEVKGAAPETVDAGAEFTTETGYGDYELELDSATVESKFDHETDFIYTVVINAKDSDGKSYGYGLRPLENVWLGNDLAWCSTPLVSQVHGCPTSYEHYASLMGKTIDSVTYYTEKGAFTFDVEDTYVPVKDAAAGIAAENANNNIDGEDPSVALSVSLPAGFDPEYSVEGWETAEVVDSAARSGESKFLKVPTGTQPGKYTLVAEDKSGKYADITCDFTLTTANEVAKFDGSAAIVAANEGDDISGYLKNIASVSVNGTSYSTSGRGAVKIINSDGTIDLNAANRGAKVFDGYGTYQVEVQSTGYEKNLTFELAIQADKTQLSAAIAAAEKLSNDSRDYSSESWDAFQKALSTAKAVADDATSSDELVAQALDGLNKAQDALQASPKNNLSYTVDQAKQLKESDYTLATWSPFSQDLSYAQGLLDQEASQPGSVSDEDLSNANEALKSSMQGLAKAASTADQTSLAVEIGKADVLKESDYTSDSWKAYQSALAAAKAAYGKEDASAEEIQKATADLASARQALVEVSADNNGSGNGGDNGNGSGSDNNGSGSDNEADNNGNGNDAGNSDNVSDDQTADGSESNAPQTGDNLAGAAGAFAAIAAAAAGAVAWARRRMLGK